jgi:PilZ domain
MGSSLLHPLRHCPFWSETSKKCQICQGGLFIPLDDHIEAYCTTLSYPQCVQYTLEHDQEYLRQGLNQKMFRNRRQFPRSQTCWKINLVRLSTSNTVATHFSAIAETIDLSRTGMRLNTQKPLPDSALLSFSFGHSFPKTPDDSIGEVMWCNKEIDSPGYQAGIAFKDDITKEAIAAYLDLHQH